MTLALPLPGSGSPSSVSVMSGDTYWDDADRARLAQLEHELERAIDRAYRRERDHQLLVTQLADDIIAIMRERERLVARLAVRASAN